MRIEIDSERCQGHLRCMGVADDLVDCDDLGYAHLIDPAGVISPAREAVAALAVTNCPERAIRIVTDH
jgi:ferredoxin